LANAARPAKPGVGDGRRRAWLRWVGVTAGAAAVLMYCYLRIAGTVPVLSDGAANALQARDMLRGNPLLHGWWVTDVSFLTTELPQYALVIAAGGLHPEVVHICAAMTYTLLVLLAAYVARGRSTGAEAVVRALVAAGIILAPEPGVASWVLLSDPDHVGTGVPLLLLLLLLDRARASRWVPVAAFAILAWGCVGDPLVEVVGALPLAVVCLARVALSLLRRQGTIRTLWYEASLAAAALLSVLAAKAVALLIPALGGYQLNKGTTGIIPLGEVPANVPLVIRSVLALFGADFQDAPTGGGRAINLAFAAVHLAGLALVLTAVAAAAWGLAGSLVWLARARADGRADVGADPDGGRADGFAVGDLVSDVIVVAIVVNVASYLVAFRISNIYSAHEIGPALALGAALAGRRLGGPLARACGLGSGTADRTGATRGRLSRVVVLPALVALLACYGAMLGFAATQRQTPPANAALAVWLRQHRLSSGLAGYWEASSVTLDSGGAITMGSIVPLRSGTLAPRHWEQDMRLYDPAGHFASFVVLAPDSPFTGKDAVRTFGQPADVYLFKTYTIMVWRKNLLPDLGPAIN
jgi:hypothetical protein